MKVSALKGVSFSRMAITATLSIAAVIGVSAWQLTAPLRSGGEELATGSNDSTITMGRTGDPDRQFDWQKSLEGISSDDPDGLSNIGENVVETLVGSYVALKDAGVYTPEQGAQIAGVIATDLKADISFRLYDTDDIKTDTSTSFTRSLAYRSDMRIALEPLLENPTYELEILGGYMETKDPKYLAELENMVRNYNVAIENAAQVVVPKDAITYHISVLNALSEFGATLAQMVKHIDDPFASAALLRTFNGAEAKMFTSFDELADYFRKSTS